MSAETSFAAIAFAQLWQVTLVAILAIVAGRTVARNRPHLAVAIWLLVLVKCVTPPIVSSPTGAFCWLQRSVSSVASVDTGTESESTRLSATPSKYGLLPIRNSIGDIPQELNARELEDASSAEWVPVESEHVAAAIVNDSQRKDIRSSFELRSVLLIVWLGGSLIAFIVSGVRCWSCLRVIRRTSQPADAAILKATDRIARKLKLRRKVRVLITDSRIGPAVIGLFRPVIVVPKAIVESAKLSEIELIIAHELIHIRRGDLLLGMFQLLAGAIWWFHPLVRLVNRMAVRDAERCCDEEVIGRFGYSNTEYARSLVNVLQCKQALIPAAAFPGVRPIDITTRRLERIMRLTNGCNKRTPIWCWLVVLLASLAVLPGAAMGVVQETIPAASEALLKSASVADEANEAAVKTTVTYEVEDLVAAMIDADGLADNETMAHKSFVWHMHMMMKMPLSMEMSQLLWEKPELATTGTVRAAWKTNGAAQPPSFLTWMEPGKTLVVAETQETHEKIQNAIEILRRAGFGQTSLSVRYVECSEAMMSEIRSKLNLSQTTESKAAPAEFESTDLPWNLDELVEHRLHAVVQRELPVVSGTLDAAEMETFMRMVKSENRSVMMAPRVTAFNGQQFSFSDKSQRPYVVDVQQDKPSIRVCDEGMTFVARMMPFGEKGTDLDFKLLTSEILQVETFTYEEAGEERTVQVPQVERSSISGTVRLAEGETYVVGGWVPPEGGRQDHRLLVLLTPRRIFQNEEVEVVGEKATPASTVRPAKREVVKEDFSDQELEVREYHFADIANQLQFMQRGAGTENVKIGPDSDILESFATEFVADYAPHSWRANGGEGTVRVDAENQSIIVSQYPSVHRRIADFVLEAQEYLSSAASLQIISIEADLDALNELQEYGLGSDVKKLSKLETYFLLQSLERDSRFSVRRQPVRTLLDSQSYLYSPTAMFSEAHRSLFELGLLIVEQDKQSELQVQFAGGTRDEISDYANRHYEFDEETLKTRPMTPRFVAEGKLRAGESMVLRLTNTTVPKSEPVVLLVKAVSEFGSSEEAVEAETEGEVLPASFIEEEAPELLEHIQYVPDSPGLGRRNSR